MITIHARMIGKPGEIDIIRIEKEDFADAVVHAKKIMCRGDVLGVQITWEKESK